MRLLYVALRLLRCYCCRARDAKASVRKDTDRYARVDDMESRCYLICSQSIGNVLGTRLSNVIVVQVQFAKFL